jgi:hypothetical protein
VGVVLFVASLFGRGHIYSWIEEPRTDLGWWLTPTWFYLRNGAILVLLAWLSWRFVREDMAPDVAEVAGGAPVEPTEVERGRIHRDAALVVVGYAFGYSLLAFDLVMSLAHKWVSNLYGAFYFMGSFLAALMWLAVLSIRMRARMGLAGLYSLKQQHDLAKLCFGLTVFWAYLMFSQFLVIWYGNLPEETFFIFYRLWGAWRPLGIAVFLMVFLIPFIGLLGERPKKAPAWLLAIALVSLAGIWIERYRDRAVHQRRRGPGARAPRARRAAVLRWAVHPRRVLVRGTVPDAFPPARRRYAGSRARPLSAPAGRTGGRPAPNGGVRVRIARIQPFWRSSRCHILISDAKAEP